jgi:ribonuclease-3 family protein
MEKGFLNATINKQQAKEMNPVVLAFIGDSIQMLYVRKRLALSHGVKSGKLHKLALLSVSAVGQADTLESIKDFLTEEETEIYKRARNSKTASAAKNAKITDYRKATGLEAVLGYLYITGQSERLEEILDLSFKETSEG